MFGGPSGKLPTGISSFNFNQVPRAQIPRSAFDRSYSHKTTGNCSALIPMYVDEVLPGDTVQLNSTIFARLLTSLVPPMDVLELTTQYFFVPNRLVWTNWEKFCGAQDNPGDSISFTIPQIGPAFAFPGPMSIWDYFGLGSTAGASNYGGTAGYLNALPFRAYNLIWNTWYRDENLQSSITVNTGNGPDANTDYQIKNRGAKKDYFFGALPFAQKGTAVPFLTGKANVYGVTPTGSSSGSIYQGWDSTAPGVGFGAMDKQAGTLLTTLSAAWGAVGAHNIGALTPGTPAQYTALGSNYTPPYADLSTNLTDVVNTLRQAFQIQKFLERDARGGTRYIELILSHFGVTNPDFRLQRPEYLGGSTSDIQSTPIPQTTPTGIAGTTTKFGDLSAFNTALSTKNGFTKSFTEHGHLIGLMSVRIKHPIYQQGVEKMWSRQTRYDYYWPVFAHLGEQTVLRKEIFYIGDRAGANTDDTVWGYIPRYDEYRFKRSLVTGVFNVNAASSLKSWHFGQYYSVAPTLTTYIEDQSAALVDNNLGVTHSATVPQLKFDIFHNQKWARPMPVFGVPGNMDRF